MLCKYNHDLIILDPILGVETSSSSTSVIAILLSLYQIFQNITADDTTIDCTCQANIQSWVTIPQPVKRQMACRWLAGGNPLIFAQGASVTVRRLNRYSKTCVKRPLKNRHNKSLNDKWKLNEGRKYRRMQPLEHSAILLTCIKIYPFLVILRVSVLHRFTVHSITETVDEITSTRMYCFLKK